ncbi:conserved hypothetical protein [Parafrankia sp. EAN1pec]|uniref:hypothetical protein n=1 Tax=Parafrankia sp. (strain EAN1pec) TaxID=298653 RepID=UPI0000543AF0|nr:conserved hypothetical protein [Frankia sp. EAN1pec]
MQLLTSTTARLVLALAAIAAPALFRARRTATPAPAATVEPLPVPAVEAPPAVVLFTADELPPVEVIAAAAADYDQAADDARAADRAKRKARKLLDRLPTGAYGEWMVSREQSARQTPDLDRIRADYARAGLGEVPMRPVASTLKVTRTPAADLAGAEAVAVAA